MNFLEELAAEWYEYNGNFVRQNIKFGGPTGKSRGGHTGEIDVAAFDPKTGILTHIETSQDADTQEERRIRFLRKFTTAAVHYKELFNFPVSRVDRVVIVGYSPKQQTLDWRLADGDKIAMKDIPSFILEISEKLGQTDPYRKAVPESLPLLRAIQHDSYYMRRSWNSKSSPSVS